MSQRILIHLRGAYPTTLKPGLLTQTMSVEARAQQPSVIVSRMMPRANPITSAPHLHRPAVYRNMADGNLTAEIGNNHDTALSDFNVEVRIERSIIRDDKPPD